MSCLTSETISNVQVCALDDHCNFIKKETPTQVFPVNFVKFLRTPFLQDTSQQLLLEI